MVIRSPLFLFLIILIEGYIVLSTEVLAIRATMPFIGSGTDTISIIIAAVLLPMATGYYFGGRYRDDNRNQRPHKSIRKKLIKNLVISAIFLFPGLSHICITEFFSTLIDMGITNRLLTTTAYALIFLVTPVFLLGQTIPLVSNYFSHKALARITGRMLFFSTIGSFLGAVFSTLVLMAFLGVNETAAFIFVLLALLTFILCSKRNPYPARFMLVLTLLAIAINSDIALSNMNVIANNQYSLIRVLQNPENQTRILSVNNNTSSLLTKDGKASYYDLLMESRFINTLKMEAAPIRILVIGAGGFTFGLADDYNHYDLVDIDGTLKEISEEHFLRQELTPNKHFHGKPARAFLAESKEPYDLVFIDVFSGTSQIPEHLVTKEFYQQVRGALTPNGAAIFNMILSPTFDTPLSRNIDSTLREVFPYLNRTIIHKHSGWGKVRDDAEHAPDATNVLYTFINRDIDKEVIYTDLKNTAFMDSDKHRKRVGVGY